MKTALDEGLDPALAASSAFLQLYKGDLDGAKESAIEAADGLSTLLSLVSLINPSSLVGAIANVASTAASNIASNFGSGGGDPFAAPRYGINRGLDEGFLGGLTAFQPGEQDALAAQYGPASRPLGPGLSFGAPTPGIAGGGHRIANININFNNSVVDSTQVQSFLRRQFRRMAQEGVLDDLLTD